MVRRRATYKIKCLTDGQIFDNIDDLLKYYNMTYDQVAYRLDHVKDYKDGMNFVRIYDNSEALHSVKAVDSRKFVERYGEQTVPLPGYEDKYTISTRGVITNIKDHDRVVPVKTRVNVKHTVILHTSDNKITQTHSLTNLMKQAFGDPDNNDEKLGSKKFKTKRKKSENKDKTNSEQKGSKTKAEETASENK